MWTTVECPYCQYENDMSDALTDLPSDNQFDHDCASCEREFEVLVEFDPIYSATEINYNDCEKCGNRVRDIKRKGEIFPYPKHYEEQAVCMRCWQIGMSEEYEMEED